MKWHWAAASCRGSSHERSGTALQDAYFCFKADFPDRSFFVSIVSDGAGSATYGGQGAALACRNISQQIRQYFKEYKACPSQQDVEDWIDNTRDRIFEVAVRRGQAARDFACTLILAISDGVNTIVAHVGDGAVVSEIGKL